MKLFRYRKPSVSTALGITKLKKRTNKSLGITAAMKPFRAPKNMERKLKRSIGYYSEPMKALRHVSSGSSTRKKKTTKPTKLEVNVVSYPPNVEAANTKVGNKGKGCNRFIIGCRNIFVAAVALMIVMAILDLGNDHKPASDSLPTLASLTSLTSTLEPTSIAEIATEPPGVTIIPTVARSSSGFVTATPGQGTVYPTATITDTPIPTSTNTSLPTAMPVEAKIIPVDNPVSNSDIIVIAPVTYYAEKQVNIRSCPGTNCERLGQVQPHTALTVDAMVNGDEVEAGNIVWYRVQYGGKVAYVYSGLMLAQLPAVPQPVIVQQSANQVSVAPAVVQPPAPSGYNGSIPKNCTEARAMGIDQYTAAQINPKLDRDNDGKACYDDQ